jgi:hypothetical protein
MTTVKLFTILFAGASLVGCAAAPVDKGGGGGEGGGGGGGEGGGGGSMPTPLNVAGTYGLNSSFDMVTNMPGTVGTIANDFIAATDQPGDPTKWIVDQIIAQLPSSVQGLASLAESTIVNYLNGQLTNFAPNFVSTMTTVGTDFSDMAKHTGLTSTLVVTASGADYTSTHTITGAQFTVQGTTTSYPFSSYGAQNIVVPGVAVTLSSSNQLSLAEQQVPVELGMLLHIGLDGAIIPLVDPNATNLTQLLDDNVNCATVGQDIYNAVNIGSPSIFTAACTAGLAAAANEIYSKIDGIDSQVLQFDMTGTASAESSGNDGRVDTLTSGAWAGTLSYAGTPAPLASATFTGSRQQ